MNNFDYALVKLILYDCVVLHEELWRLSKPLEETHQSFQTEFTMGRKWRVTFLPGQTDFLPVAIKLDPLDEPFIYRRFFLDNAE